MTSEEAKQRYIDRLVTLAAGIYAGRVYDWKDLSDDAVVDLAVDLAVSTVDSIEVHADTMYGGEPAGAGR